MPCSSLAADAWYCWRASLCDWLYWTPSRALQRIPEWDSSPWAQAYIQKEDHRSLSRTFELSRLQCTVIKTVSSATVPGKITLCLGRDMTQMLPDSHIKHFHYIMELDVISPLQLRNYLSRIVPFFSFSWICDYNNTTTHQMGTEDFCEELRVWEFVQSDCPSDSLLIGHRCFTCSQFLWLLSTKEWEIQHTQLNGFQLVCYQQLK